MSDLINKNQSLIEWKEDFKDFVEGLYILRDDYYYDVDLGVITSNCNECWVQKQIDSIEKDEE